MADMRVALITGITGQDGYYLARLLLDKGYKVHGVRQALAHDDRAHIKPLLDDITLHYGDMTDQTSLNNVMQAVQPDEVYNLAAQSHVGVSFAVPEYTMNVNGHGVKRLLDAMRAYAPKAKFYQAGTSELFGNSPAPQNEETAFDPQSPYAEAKLYAHQTVVEYRQQYGLYAVNGILFNHESPKRGDDFVTQKIVKAACAILKGAQDILYLGNLDAVRDWGHAEDYVEGMWRMLQQDAPDDYVLATGTSCSVRDFVCEVFGALGHDIIWQGQGAEEVGMLLENNREVVRIAPEFYRPAEVHNLIGDSRKAQQNLDWSIRKTRYNLIQDMIDAELNKDARAGGHIQRARA
tara:strand:+ start:5251 stop:6297 length:1047 start_codon:yes stop_codon:yes gene_type:complete